MSDSVADNLPDCIVLSGEIEKYAGRGGGVELVDVVTAGRSVDDQQAIRLEACIGTSRIGWSHNGDELYLRICDHSRLGVANFVPSHAAISKTGTRSSFVAVEQFGRLWRISLPRVGIRTQPTWTAGLYTYIIVLTRSRSAADAIPPIYTVNPSPVVPQIQPRVSNLTLSSNDTCFLFRRTRQVLFARKDALIAASSYYRDLFEGGFAEARNTVNIPIQAWSDALQLAIGQTFDRHGPTGGRRLRGDDENSDEDEASDASPVPAANRSLSAVDAVRYVMVDHHDIRTYHAMLHYIGTGVAEFSTLRSRRDGQTAMSWTSSSPKSIYALAHEVRLEHLQQLAVADFKRQLNINNVIKEIFSDASFTYPALKEAAFEVLRSVWPQLRSAGGLDEVDRLLDASLNPRRIARMQTEMLRAVAGF